MVSLSLRFAGCGAWGYSGVGMWDSDDLGGWKGRTHLVEVHPLHRRGMCHHG